MDNDFSFDPEFLGIPGFEKPELPYEERIVKADEFRKEIAFHEASHFVFHVLGLAHVTGFTSIKFAICCAHKVNQEDLFNVVQGFAPDIPHSQTFGNDEIEAPGYLKFFNEDRKRLVASLFSTIAGYSSYAVFIQKRKFYIFSSVEKVGQKQFKIKYYDLKNAKSSDTSDFNKLFRKFHFYYFSEAQLEKLGYDKYNLRDSKIKALTVLTEKVQHLMRQRDVNDSVRTVKNKLLKTECQKIEGYRLNKLVKKVEKMTKKIDINAILEALKDKLG